MQPFEQHIRFVAFRTNVLEEELELRAGPFPPKEPFKQLRQAEQHVARHVPPCVCIAIEEHYIDRDHMEDHSVFYARSLFPYPNHCKRVHFFSKSIDEVQSSLDELRREAANKDADAYRKACRDFSTSSYLGFCVIRPLRGCPVGRTILSAPDGQGEASARPEFNCTRIYEVHFLGVDLFVKGLPFQQQDKAVAACATTAIWSSLHMARGLEDIGHATPAQITMRAAQNSLPFGRAMPSEGLSVDQMCQAIQATGVSPLLQKADKFDVARALLYSATESAVAPVLITKTNSGHHAVTVAGMLIREDLAKPERGVLDRAASLDTVYIHDDRLGPYIPAKVKKYDTPENKSLLVLILPQQQKLEVTHILIPMHAKVRNAFNELRAICLELASDVGAWREAFGDVAEATTPLHVDAWIERGHRYTFNLSHLDGVAMQTVKRLTETVVLPRYVGVIRLWGETDLDKLDVLIDTTSTDRNIHAVAVLATAETRPATLNLARYLNEKYQCHLITEAFHAPPPPDGVTAST